MTSSSLFRHGVAELKADVAANAKAAAEAQAALVVANRERLRLDAPAVDPKLLRGAQAVFVRGRGWFFVKSVNQSTVTVFRVGLIGFERVPFARIVDFR